MVKRIVNKLQRICYKSNTIEMSFSQTGEDLIVKFIFQNLFKTHNFTYLDIGANHPTFLNNTYLFYINGNRGICVEPDPVSLALLKKIRPEDTCLNVGIGKQDKTDVPFYIVNPRVLNTFSKEQLDKTSSFCTLEKVININIYSINSILKKHFYNNCPDFISIDIEGLDTEVLESIDFNQYRPSVICVETIDNSNYKKNNRILKFMENNNYLVYADTFINTIFVEGNKMKNCSPE